MDLISTFLDNSLALDYSRNYTRDPAFAPHPFLADALIARLRYTVDYDNLLLYQVARSRVGFVSVRRDVFSTFHLGAVHRFDIHLKYLRTPHHVMRGSFCSNVPFMPTKALS